MPPYSFERTLVSIEGASNGLLVNAVSEPGLYILILGSRKPEAKTFKRWITYEVLPLFYYITLGLFCIIRCCPKFFGNAVVFQNSLL